MQPPMEYVILLLLPLLFNTVTFAVTISLLTTVGFPVIKGLNNTGYPFAKHVPGIPPEVVAALHCHLDSFLRVATAAILKRRQDLQCQRVLDCESRSATAQSAAVGLALPVP